MSADALPRSKKDVDAFVRREILTRIASDAAGDHVDSDKLKAAQQIYDLPFKDVLARGSTWRDFKKDSPQALRYCPGRLYLALLRDCADAIKEEKLAPAQVFAWATLIAEGKIDPQPKPPVEVMLVDESKDSYKEAKEQEQKLKAEHAEAGEPMAADEGSEAKPPAGRKFTLANPTLDVRRQLASTDTIQVTVPIESLQYIGEILRKRPWAKVAPQQEDPRKGENSEKA